MNELQKRVATAYFCMQRMSWEQGMGAQAMWELGETELALNMTREAIHRTHLDVFPACVYRQKESIDTCINALPLYYAYLHTDNADYLERVERIAAWMEDEAPRSSDGHLYHLRTNKIIMIDGIYHILPALIATKRYDFAKKQIELYYERHFDEATGLFHQVWDDELGDFSKPLFWSGGEGWMAGALAVMCRMLGNDAPTLTSEMGDHLVDLVSAMLSYVGEDGMFHDTMDDPSTFKEMATTCILSYAIYIGVDLGILDEGLAATADSLMDLCEEHIDEDGFVLDAVASPHFDRPGFSPEAQAFFLLADNERKKRGSAIA